jgi:uncharacterized protein
MTKDEILKKLEENRETVRSFEVREIGLFGSYARDKQKEGSDIDILVDFENPSLHNYFSLKSFLEKLFDCKVDLAFKSTIKPRIRNKVWEETIYVKGL